MVGFSELGGVEVEGFAVGEGYGFEGGGEGGVGDKGEEEVAELHFEGLKRFAWRFQEVVE
jgi:hypothetical protein